MIRADMMYCYQKVLTRVAHLPVTSKLQEARRHHVQHIVDRTTSRTVIVSLLAVHVMRRGSYYCDN